MRSLVSCSLSVAALLLSGCPAGFTALAPTTCAELTGDFTATDFAVASTEDPVRANDFLAAGDAVNLGFDDGTVTSTFTPADGDPLVSSGTIDPDNGAITLDPGTTEWVPGLEPGLDEISCELDEDTGAVTLTADTGFDFDEDGVFEPATLTGTFEAL